MNVFLLSTGIYSCLLFVMNKYYEVFKFSCQQCFFYESVL